MNDRGDFRNEADRAVILKLAAQMAALHPGRSEPAGNSEPFIHRMAKLAGADRQSWESQRRKATAAGVEGATDLTYEELKQLVERGDDSIGTPTPGHFFEREPQSVTEVHNLLLRRDWLVAKAAPGSGGFITSDHPVILSWNDKEMERGIYPPGFGLRGTSVFFPISKDLVMRGRFDGRVGTLELPVDMVAGIDSRTIFHAGQRVYAESDQVRFLDRNLLLRYGQDLLPELMQS